jgi:hypothetical protein
MSSFMSCTSHQKEGIFRRVDPLLLVRQAFHRAGGTQQRLCGAVIEQIGEANGGLGEAEGQPEVHPPGPGLTFAKLAECQYVMEVLGDLPLRVAYERLAGMVYMLGEDVQAMALRNAYAIDMPAPDTLTRRCERIAGIHGLSIDTIERYERNMIDELALRLLHGELPVGG